MCKKLLDGLLAERKIAEMMIRSFMHEEMSWSLADEQPVMVASSAARTTSEETVGLLQITYPPIIVSEPTISSVIVSEPPRIVIGARKAPRSRHERRAEAARRRRSKA